MVRARQLHDSCGGDALLNRLRLPLEDGLQPRDLLADFRIGAAICPSALQGPDRVTRAHTRLLGAADDHEECRGNRSFDVFCQLVKFGRIVNASEPVRFCVQSLGNRCAGTLREWRSSAPKVRKFSLRRFVCACSIPALADAEGRWL